MSTTTPPGTPLQDAATAPISPSGATTYTKLRDWGIVIIAPFCVPAVLLALARSSRDVSFFSAFTLSEVSFGFVAVAIASIARAIALKSEAALAFSIFAVIIVGVQIVLAVKTDSVIHTNMMVNTLSHLSSPSQSAMAELKATAMSISDSRPTGFDWGVSFVTGVGFMAISFELIRRDI